MRDRGHVVGEPVTGRLGHLLQGAGLLEEVGGAGDDREPVLAAQPGLCIAVEVEYQLVVAPTISSVGAVTSGSRGPARSGLPPRETTAAIRAPGSATAHNAAAAPVLAPKYPTASPSVSGCMRSRPVASASRRASRPVSKTLARSVSSASVSRSNGRVPSPARFSPAATNRFHHTPALPS
jgi:hypothetical protein